MKKELVIIGGGFAGFWSAISAIRQSRKIKRRDHVNITVINTDDKVTIRPTQMELFMEGSSFEMDHYFKPLGISLLIGKVTWINPEVNEILMTTEQDVQTIKYDYLILSSGVSMHPPNIKGIENTFKVDSIANAKTLESHLIEIAQKKKKGGSDTTILVVGSQYMGLETVINIEQKAQALQLYYTGVKVPFRIILLEEEAQLATGFSQMCRGYIEKMLQLKNVELIINSKVISMDRDSIMLNNGLIIPSKTVIWTKEIMANELTQFFNGARNHVGRLYVDAYLKLPQYNNVIAAGSVAHMQGNESQDVLIDCQYAQFEGRWAGHNAINDLFSNPLKGYEKIAHIPCVDLGEPPSFCNNHKNEQLQKKIYNQLSRERYINRTSMFPWQDIEATVQASYPEFYKNN